jgi:hypothetical protein
MTETLIIKDYNNRRDYEFEFDRIAKVILNNFELRTLKSTYIISEIEFYYYSRNHTDYYCHKNLRQLLNSRFYFHRFKDPDKYSNLKQKGTDITIGDNNNTFGGILIRAIQDKESAEFYTGIGNITNRIIEEIGGTSEIQKLYDSDISVFNNSTNLYLQNSINNGLKIFKKKRQGLNHDTIDSDKFYINAPYNYFTYPKISELL